MTAEQKTRLEELQAKATLTAEETEELKTLAALPQEVDEEDPDAEFDAAWDELDGKKPEDTTNTQKNQDAGKKPDESQSTGPDNSDGDILNFTPADSDITPDSTDGDVTPDPRDEKIVELQEEIKQLTHNMKSWEGRLKAADKRAAEAEQKLKDAETKGQSEESGDASPDEDDAQLSAFFKEFPDLEDPIKTVAEKIATRIVNDKMAKIEAIEANQQTLQETADEEANRKHMEIINAAHPDWEQIYNSGALEAWIKRQPSYLQPRLYEIISDGSAQEVVDMFSSYKRAAGKDKETTTNTVTDPKKKEKVKAMEAVPASTAGPKKGEVKIAKDDFDGAWDALEKEEAVLRK